MLQFLPYIYDNTFQPEAILVHDNNKKHLIDIGNILCTI